MRQLVVLLALSVAIPAVAAESVTAAPAAGRVAAAGTVRDARDSLGPLDIAAASAHVRAPRRRRSGSLLVLRLRTYGPWGNADLVTRGVAPNGFTFEFGRRASIPRCFDIRPTLGGGLTGQMWRSCFPIRFGRLGAPIRLRRTSPRRAEASVPLRLLGRGASRVRWRAISSYEAVGHPTCSLPVYLPPEHPYGTCADITRQGRIKSPPPA